jgi:arylsulfatase A-like enzyme/uncharacterized protein HemY
VGLLTGLLLGFACAGEQTFGPTLSDGTPVVLISVDTLRSDRLPAYGYEAVETPSIDALRRDSILFERAYSHVPLTLPSHASILTGLLPTQHQVRSNMGYRFAADAHPYLPRLLREAGYRTGAAVSAFVLRGNTGIGSDWDFFEDRIEVTSDVALGRLQRPGGETLDLILPWLRSIQEEPFLLFFHVYEPHTPYEPPEPFASRYQDRYDGEVAASDAIVGRLLDELAAMDLYDRSLVIFLSDHGEGLGDHDQPEHELLIYREILQVPLMLKLPRGERGGESVARAVQLTDVAPTILSLLGRTIPPEMRGTPLLATGTAIADRPVYSETLYPRLHFGWSELTSVIRDRYHYIHGPAPELYDLAADPDEERNILQQERQVSGDLRLELESLEASFQAPAEVDPRTREKLAALGYLGSVGAPSSGPLADPKTRLEVLGPLGVAFSAFFDREYEQAAIAFREIVDKEPQLVDAWEHLGKSLYQLDRFDEALEASEEAIRLSAAAPGVLLSTAELLLEMGRLEEARELAEEATASHESAWDVLTQIALQQEDLEAAEGYLDKALEFRGTRAGPLVLKARLRLDQDRFDEALEATQQAEAEVGEHGDRGQLRGLYFAWGQAWASEGDLDKAKTFLLREIELNPDALGPYTHLAFLYALEANGPAAGALLRDMVEANPTPSAYAAAVQTLKAMKDERSAATLLSYARRRWPGHARLEELGG